MIRCLDILFSLIGLLVLSPVFLLVMIILPMDSRGGVFFLQNRVGKDAKDFRLIKFRTMVKNAQNQGSLTVGSRDARITPAGHFLRRHKLDEIPQLFNVLKGEMSLVGPRPEVRKYAELYTLEQRRVLSVRPGLTDYASIEYINENEILGGSPDPERTYIDEVMPAKIELNMRFINHPTLANYFSILGKTLFRILG